LTNQPIIERFRVRIQYQLAPEDNGKKIIVRPITGSQLVDKSTNNPKFQGWNTAEKKVILFLRKID
jgi:hypothetical protein